MNITGFKHNSKRGGGPKIRNDKKRKNRAKNGQSNGIVTNQKGAFGSQGR